MAHFYGTVKGAKGEASREGSKGSGLRVVAASYEGSIELWLGFDGSVQRDRFEARMCRHGQSGGWEGRIAHGIMGEMYEQPGILPVPTLEAILDTATVADLELALQRRKAIVHANAALRRKS